MAKDECKIRFGSRDVSPCMNCTERFLACADRCPKDARGEYGYNAWKAKRKSVEDKRRTYNSLNRRRKWQKINT